MQLARRHVGCGAGLGGGCGGEPPAVMHLQSHAAASRGALGTLTLPPPAAMHTGTARLCPPHRVAAASPPCIGNMPPLTAFGRRSSLLGAAHRFWAPFTASQPTGRGAPGQRGQPHPARHAARRRAQGWRRLLLRSSDRLRDAWARPLRPR
eukprot:6032134-Prymnesium_polylepis.1